MSNEPNVNEVSKAHLDQKEHEVELQAVKNHYSTSHMAMLMSLKTAPTVRMAGCSIHLHQLERQSYVLTLQTSTPRPTTRLFLVQKGLKLRLDIASSM
ncbi:UNVERIFIED_CONTAM: hypothetical protein NCL1_22011 [Trichonephila clavipes]